MFVTFRKTDGRDIHITPMSVVSVEQLSFFETGQSDSKKNHGCYTTEIVTMNGSHKVHHPALAILKAFALAADGTKIECQNVTVWW